jgi:predicted transposase/invertase (TIGR01784 family)
LTYDNICKYLAEQYPANFIRWLFSSESTEIQVLKTELSLEPIRADSVTLLQTSNQILHLEFQTLPESDPPMPLRMLDYWVRLHRQYRCPVEQVVIYLKTTTSESAFVDRFQAANTNHRYRVVRMWEQDPTQLLAESALLPLAPLARTDSPQRLLEQVAAQVARIESTEERRNVAASVALLAGLRFDPNLIKQLFREDIMKESAIYQEILQEGVRQGIERGQQFGRAVGRAEGWKDGEAALIIRLLTRKLGAVDSATQERIRNLSSTKLEELGEALLDFSDATDLANWLRDRAYAVDKSHHYSLPLSKE